MGRKRMPGLQKIGNIWHIEKRVNGCRISESTGTSKLEEAEKYLIRRLETIRQATVYGVRPKRTFREAAMKFLLENQHKKSISCIAGQFKVLDAFIGDLALESVHMGTLQPYIESRRKQGMKARTINYGLQAVRHILNLAAGEWMDEYGLTWLASTPKIKLLPETDKRKPYPLNWDEQEELFSKLSVHLREMSLYAVNTGSRDQEVCNLRWRWEVQIPGLGSIFIIPGEFIKNGQDKVIVLNKTAQAVIDRQRGKHPEFVFVYRGKPITRMVNNGWRKAREEAGLPQVRFHDLRHTFGRRLRAAGVSFEDRQDLLGHKSSRMTTHYSVAELANLFAAANKICDRHTGPTLTLLRPVQELSHEKRTKPVLSLVSNGR